MNKLLKGLLFTGAVCTSLMAYNSVEAKDADGNIVVVIDAGHGGDDCGAKAVTGAYESKCNFAIAEAMKSELTKYDGVKVYLTREENTWMTNTGRAMIAADLNADFLISLHNNSGSDTNTGALAYRSLNTYYSEVTNDMCTRILDNLSALGLKNGGVQTRTSTSFDYEDYYTIIGEGVRAGVPSIIVEHCFLSNPNDAALVSNADGSLKYDFLGEMGIADATAVASYFKLSKRTAIADNNTSIELEKGYGVSVSTVTGVADGVTWFSTNQNVASVDEKGNVTALGSGTANIVYQLSDGTEGSCTVKVNAPVEVTLTGGIDPTFYQTLDEFKNIDKQSAFAYVIYSDGSAQKVKPDFIEDIDTSKVGIQDVEIKYGKLKGRLRVCHNNETYVPEVTLPAKEEITSAPTEMVTKGESETAAPTADSEKKDNGLFKQIAIYVIVLAALVGIGFVIIIIEKKNKKKRRRNRSRKYL